MALVSPRRHNQIGSGTPDVDAGDVRGLYEAVQTLLDQDLVLAYHDRSDGGLFTAVAEMAFAGRCGVELTIDTLGDDSARRALLRGSGRGDPISR